MDAVELTATVHGDVKGSLGPTATNSAQQSRRRDVFDQQAIEATAGSNQCLYNSSLILDGVLSESGFGL